MLRFQTPPDKIFMAILTESMEMMIDQMRETLSVHREKEVDTVSLESLMPNASRVFAPETALKILKRMLHCHKGPGFYRLNDYHFLLLYDVLGYFCDIHNDMVHTTPHAEEKIRCSTSASINERRWVFMKRPSVCLRDWRPIPRSFDSRRKKKMCLSYALHHAFGVPARRSIQT
jgi:hypothetical protein